MSGGSADDRNGFWASTPVCGPYPKALGVAALKTVPALGFACCRAAGTAMCIPPVQTGGLDPVRIIKPEGPMTFDRTAKRHGYALHPLLGLRSSSMPLRRPR
jgi:hypothetical protein